ncbi:XdhC family protein [Hymenobacter sp. 15J16-1T3B]|uniref:XdhC family protein n=1 Tax=Hymenobacter sp. 15J16-1T3B TaxID=2886941 RepID=UPI001D115AEA|nr:XdhC/CoxI family protein [Hymenobacter sp. 15J16-1T3B]MCC3158827.1 XdhC family protein [Hymenobacter sp. 15J16-1T3B]
MDLFNVSPSVPRDLLVWQHAMACLRAGIPVSLLLVARSSGSSPGRQGFKMSVAPGSMVGSIGGGIMEHKFVELARRGLSEGRRDVLLREQIHRGEAPHNRSGMICSGEQTLLLLPLTEAHLPTLRFVAEALQQHRPAWLRCTAAGELFAADGAPPLAPGLHGSATGEDWQYIERLGFRDQLTIVGGGHVGLALSQVVANLDFRLTVLDNRAGLNTLQLNPYAHEKRTLDYAALGPALADGPHQYVVVMTFGYRTDAVALRQLIGRPFAYLGVMGSAAKIATMRQELLAEGYSEEQLARVHAPIGLPIHSRTPEEIAISVAAELIRVRNAPRA